MADTLRAFVAVQLSAPPPLVAVLSQLRQLGRAVKAMAAENLHVTLKFLGDTDSERIPEIKQLLQESVAGQPEFVVRLRGLGAFPHAGRPSVIWAGLLDAEPLERMASELETRLEPLGYPAEARRFQPHLTLARVKAAPPGELQSILLHHTTTDFGSAVICKVELIESELHPSGSRYRIWHTEPLTGAE